MFYLTKNNDALAFVQKNLVCDHYGIRPLFLNPGPIHVYVQY
jgi:hypothetical protein